MSIFSTIKVDIETFFKDLETSAGKFCAAFLKIFKAAPSALQVVQNFVNELAPVVVAAVGFAAPAADSAVAAALATVQIGLAAIQATLTAANSGQSLLADLQDFANSVPQLLTGLDIKDANLKTEVENIVSLINNEAKVLIPAVEAWVKSIASAAPSAS